MLRSGWGRLLIELSFQSYVGGTLSVEFNCIGVGPHNSSSAQTQMNSLGLFDYVVCAVNIYFLLDSCTGFSFYFTSVCVCIYFVVCVGRRRRGARLTIIAQGKNSNFAGTIMCLSHNGYS
jgi:hypothetical protein